MRAAALCLLLAGCFDYHTLSAGLDDASSNSDASQSTDGAQVADGAMSISLDLETSPPPDLAQPPSDLAGTDLAPNCECFPSTTRMLGCGNCGTEIDTCGSDCKWVAGACMSQGVCTPGEMSDCSTSGEVKTCATYCAWGPCVYP